MMTSEKCPKCGYVNITTCSPNGIEGVWISNSDIEKIDEMKVISQGEVLPYRWLHDHGIRTIRCAECRELSKTEDENNKKPIASITCELCGYSCESSAQAWHDNGAKALNRHQTCHNVEQNGRQIDEIVELIEVIDNIDYLREVCRERGLL
jgi:phage FluMu protein Com